MSRLISKQYEQVSRMREKLYKTALEITNDTVNKVEEMDEQLEGLIT